MNVLGRKRPEKGKEMAVAVKKKKDIKGLGRGLDALLGEAPTPKAPPARAVSASTRVDSENDKRELPIEYLSPNKHQPRQVFQPEAIEDLAASITAQGMLQPILVRPVGPDAYEIVAGERRWRAAQKAKLHNVPVIIRELTDEQSAEIAVIENVQRVDLNPVEEARGYKRLMDEFGRTQEKIAIRVGKSRSHVANMLRLLSLPEKLLNALVAGDLSMGHARALLGSREPEKACALVLKGGLSVRETEALVRREGAGEDVKNADAPKGSSSSSAGAKDADTRALERDLAAILGLEVDIAHSRAGAGVVTIKYLNLDQLDDVCKRLMGTRV